MAKLGAYYALCPLIDANSILGISEELGKGLVIVTLGKNISSRYKVRMNFMNMPLKEKSQKISYLDSLLYQ